MISEGRLNLDGLFIFIAMKLEKLILAGAIAFLIRRQASKISYDILRSYIFKWDFDGVIIRADVRINNASAAALKVDGFQGELKYKGVKIADVGLINGVNIQSGESGSVTIGAKVLYGPATSVLLEAIQAGRFENKITLKGELCAGRFTLPVSKQLSL